jgi:hypothetical protein
MRSPQLQGLGRVELRLRRSSTRSSLRGPQAGKGTYCSARRYRNFDVFWTSGYHAVREIRNPDSFGDVVVAGRDDLDGVSEAA